MVRALDVISMHLLWIVLGVIYLSVSPTSALIPEQCVHNVTTPYAVCCPIDPNNGMVCGGPHRGYCEKIVVPHEDIPPMFHMDDRLAWPLRYFSHTCQCNDRFFGVACERCWFGWTGPKCDIPKKIVRRDIRSLSPRELEIHKVLMKKSETWPSGYAVIDETNNWNSDPLNAPRFVSASVHHYIAFLHRFGSRSTLYKNEKDCNDYAILNFNHDGVVFPTWHRHYNLVWEMLLGDIAFKLYGIHDYAIPYWDFIGLKSCDICTNKYFGAPGKEDEDGVHLSRHSLFHNTTEHCYEPEDGTACFGCRRDKRPSTITRHFRALDFPTQMDLEYVLSLKR